MATYKLTPEGDLETNGVIEAEDNFSIDSDGYIHCYELNENQDLTGDIKMIITVDYIVNLAGVTFTTITPGTG